MLTLAPKNIVPAFNDLNDSVALTRAERLIASHKTASPWCTGFDRYYTDQGVKQPLFEVQRLLAQDNLGFVTSAQKVVPLADDRNNGIYQCVADKPTTGTYYPSKWVQQEKYFSVWERHHLNQTSEKSHTVFGYATQPNTEFSQLHEFKFEKPTNYGKFFFGYDAKTMCDEELQAMVLLGRKTSVPRRFLGLVDQLFIFDNATRTTKCFDLDGEEVPIAGRASQCGRCSVEGSISKVECSNNDGEWTPYTLEVYPNVNDVQSCFEHCGGWCLKDQDKTNAAAVPTQQCSVTGDDCSSTTCANVCENDPETSCKTDGDCESGTCQPQTCDSNPRLIACTSFTRTENMRRYCDVTGEDSLQCNDSRRNTYFVAKLPWCARLLGKVIGTRQASTASALPTNSTPPFHGASR